MTQPGENKAQSEARASEQILRDEIIEYYENTSLDYASWSRNFNMHFGYWRRWMNPFSREPMLEEMNRQVMDRLQLPAQNAYIIDLGCGLGATLRSIATKYPHNNMTGVTLVDWQCKKAESLNSACGLDHAINLVQANYLDVPVQTASVDAAYALESCCHSPGEEKRLFLAELFRLLKPGARCVIVDGFTKVPRSRFTRLFKYCIDTTCNGWALPCFPAITPFLDEMHRLGFAEITVEDASWRIAPSAIHSPFCVAGFLIRKWLEGEKLNRTRLGHLRSCLLGLILGMSRRQFGYYIISASKPLS